MNNYKHVCMLLLGWLTCIVLFSACKKDVYDPNKNEPAKDIFDFATTVDKSLDIDYGMKGNKAVFEVFTEDPVILENGKAKKKENVKSILKAYTDEDCTYSGIVNLPTACTKIYLYSENYILPTSVEVEVENSGIKFNLKDYIKNLQPSTPVMTSQMAIMDKALSRAYTETNPYNIQFLGGYDNNGMPDYLQREEHNGITYPVAVDVPNGLVNRLNDVLTAKDNSSFAVSTKVINTNVLKDASIKLTFLGEEAEYRNAIGYYYYETQNPPSAEEFESLPKYIAFPNCSTWGSNSGITSNYMPPLWSGHQIQLKYFDKNGKETNVFPAGITIGWFMIPDGFEVYKQASGNKVNIVNPKYGIRYSNNEFNKDNKSVCISLYDEKSKTTVNGFEDGGDKDYKDVFFYLTSTPEEAIYDPNKPTTDPDEEYPPIESDALEGTLVFEDLWPSQGDYDMNDVVVTYHTTFTTDKDNKIIGIKDIFTPIHAGGALKSAFGYQMNMDKSDIDNIKIENSSSTALNENGMEINQDKPTFMLFDDIQQAVKNGAITVTLELAGKNSINDVSRKKLYNPFICVSTDGFNATSKEARREIHLTNYPPTPFANLYFFGRNNDKSSLDQEGNPIGPNYYVAEDNYPFAIDLPITDYQIPDESVKIDKFYPGFYKWAKSKGEENKDWYEYPASK